MKETVGFIMLLLTQAAMASTALQHPNTTIEGKVGDTVILPCSTKNKMDISHDQVEWLVKDPTDGKYKHVHLYHQGVDQLYNQRDDFKDRTSLFKEELSSGNCSLSLLVNTSHSGTYYCYVPGHICGTTTLKVLPAEEDDTSQKHQDVTESPDKPNNGLTTTQIVGIAAAATAAALLLIGIIIALVYCYRKHLHPQRNPSNPSNGQELEDLAQQPPQNQENEPEDQNPNEEQMLENDNQDDPAADN